MHPDQIKELIRAGMACEHLALDGDGQHFAAIVVSAEFVGLNRVQRQQHVYRTIKDELASVETAVYCSTVRLPVALFMTLYWSKTIAILE